jgi:hypothetical protein
MKKVPATTILLLLFLGLSDQGRSGGQCTCHICGRWLIRVLTQFIVGKSEGKRNHLELLIENEYFILRYDLNMV